MRFREFGLRLSLVGGLCGLCCVGGCGDGGGSPSSLSGQVTLGGEPVEDGNLVLRPSAGTSGAPAAVKITGGKYDVPKDKGLVAGDYAVQITATRPGEDAQYIPDQYNVQSKLTVLLAAGENAHDFDLDLGEVTSVEIPDAEAEANVSTEELTP